jgi:Fe2+ transport system protein B
MDSHFGIILLFINVVVLLVSSVVILLRSCRKTGHAAGEQNPPKAKQLRTVQAPMADAAGEQNLLKAKPSKPAAGLELIGLALVAALLVLVCKQQISWGHPLLWIFATGFTAAALAEALKNNKPNSRASKLAWLPWVYVTAVTVAFALAT